MHKVSLDRSVVNDISWWHWALTIPLLIAHLTGVAWAIHAAICLCGLMVAYYGAQIGNVRAFPVQVRFAYFALLVLGTFPGQSWLHWVQLAGTTSMVTIGYCPLARLLRLLPFNRYEPLSGACIWQIVFLDPCFGGFIKWTDLSMMDRFLPSCSLQSRKIRQELLLPNRVHYLRDRVSQMDRIPSDRTLSTNHH